MNKTVFFRDLGRTEYRAVWDYQTRLFDRTVERKMQNRAQGTDTPTDNYLFFTEHNPVYTLGRHGDPSHLLIPPSEMEKQNIAFCRIDRGGDITYHGPGQIVGYPLLDLDNFSPDIHLYVHLLEETVIRTLSDFAIHSGRCPGRSGVWIDPQSPSARKICAIGVRTSRWVTMHGFALNVNTDLRYFSHIVPCGISDRGVTSLERETGTPADTEAVKSSLLRHFSEVFGCHIAPFPED